MRQTVASYNRHSETRVSKKTNAGNDSSEVVTASAAWQSLNSVL